ncbi:MAG: CDP-diacylglycerol-glycerol-3-phosphate 3-phosphatidyltransferase, partial [Gammaproteobacteria bacterium]|nr:CDP-diacylglycerol-glycerol-3-phosphate 3-phosphatidyltransferase [Gammaproteobacteria bacterium]
VGKIGGVYLAIPAAIIIGREIAISGLREWMAEIGKRAHVAVGQLGKIKTAMQMLALLLLLFYQPETGYFFMVIKVLGLISLYLAAALTLWSLFIYLKAAWSDLTSSVNKE